MRAPLLVVFGHRYRCDDGVGPLVYNQFPEHDRFHCHGDPMGLMLTLNQRSSAVLVDCLAGPEPGRIHRWNWGETPPAVVEPHFSSHGLGVTTILQLLEAEEMLPPRLAILALEGEDFGWGEELSDAVVMAFPKFVELTRRVLSEFSQVGHV